MTMSSATYKVAKASGGCCHYAEVTVETYSTPDESSVELSPEVFASMKDVYGPDDKFCDAAITGVRYALANCNDEFSNKCRVEITSIKTTIVDSSWDSVAIASCFAFWESIDTQGVNHPYWEGRKVVFPKA